MNNKKIKRYLEIEEQYDLKLLSAKDNFPNFLKFINGFDCELEFVNKFIKDKDSCFKLITENISSTIYLISKKTSEFVGYISFSSTSLNFKNIIKNFKNENKELLIDNEIKEFKQLMGLTNPIYGKNIPCLKIEVLGIDKKFNGKSLGPYLLMKMESYAYDKTPPFKLMILDAIIEKKEWYKKQKYYEIEFQIDKTDNVSTKFMWRLVPKNI